MEDNYKNLPTFHFSKEISSHHEKNSLRGLMFGNFGAMNQGDEAILAGEIQELQKIPDVTITAVGRFPEEIRRLHGIAGVSLYAWGAVIREIYKSDFVVVGGGGLINKPERGAIGFLYQLYILFLFFLVPLLFKKKLYVLGVGIYNNASSFILNLVLLLLKKASIVTVRDEHSYDLLQARNVSARLYKDNSFLMELLPVSQVHSDAFFKKHYRKGNMQGKMQIGISLLKPENKEEEEHLLHELAEYISRQNAVADFWFYSLDNNPSYFNDESFGGLLYEAVLNLGVKDLCFNFVPANWPPQEIFSSFKLMDYIITMRLHGMIFAYRNGVPFTGISYDKKCASFLRSIGKEPVEIKSLTQKDLIEV